MLEFERALELFGFDDGVDAELAGVAVVGVLQAAFAALEQLPRAPMHEPGRRRQDELNGHVSAALGHQRDERFGEGVLVVAGGLDREDERRVLLEAHDVARPFRAAVDLDEFDVGVEVFERPADRRVQVVGRGDDEADRCVGEAVDFEREVFGAAPEAFVPAHADRAGDALEGLLHVVGVGEVVAAEPQLPAGRSHGHGGAGGGRG